ncbi:hypothetical protein QQP08_024165, partial [Theobroma cacao]
SISLVKIWEDTRDFLNTENQREKQRKKKAVGAVAAAAAAAEESSLSAYMGETSLIIVGFLLRLA